MLNNCYSIKSLPLFDTAKVTTMQQMCINCYSLKEVPLFNTVLVTNMNNMFLSCFSLQSAPLLNTVAVTNMQGMFQGCSSLATISALNTAAVTTGNGLNMFSGCTSLAKARTNGLRFAVSYSGCRLSAAQINDIFTGLGTASGAQTITVSNNFGYATCTPSIATAKGWTVA
jgi:surface protein